LNAKPDETSIVTKPCAASQSLATTSTAHHTRKAGDDVSDSLILLMLRRHRNETQRNNAAALIGRRGLSMDRKCQPLLALMTKSHKIVNTPIATRGAGYGLPLFTLSSSAKGDVLNQTKRLSDRLRSSSYVKEHSSGVAKEKCAEGI
jgi:hypothetical protein